MPHSALTSTPPPRRYGAGMSKPESKAGDVLPTQGATRDTTVPRNASSKRWRPPTRIGLGGVAIGNAFTPTTDEDAHATLAASWDAGVRYYDTSPFYGFGLSERRFGHFLKN